MSQRESRNPFYLLLLIASFLFVVTALAYAFVPTLEDKARRAGADVPASPWRDSLKQDGWRWLLVEVAAMIVFGLGSMGWDRLRTLQSEQTSATIPPTEQQPQSPDTG